MLKGGTTMSSEAEMIAFQKAAVYDLLRILKKNQKDGSSNTDKEYSIADLEKLFDAYIAGKEG